MSRSDPSTPAAIAGTSSDDDGAVWPAAVRDAPATATAVYATLAVSGPMSYGRLAEATGASRRAVEGAILTLREADLVESRYDVSRPARKVHRAKSAKKTTTQ